MVPPGTLRDAFLDAHRDLLDADWWSDMQTRASAGLAPDTYPYSASRRLV
jgi:isocitrate dehydrogenase kinase/phosphatase